MLNKAMITAFAAATVIGLAIPAAAETFTAENGVISIELPNENWKEIEDPAKWIALSDGANLITVDHYSNGEKMPDIVVADDHYVNVYEAVFSTQNEVFIITGSVVDSSKIPEVCNAIMSAKVLQYDTKLAVKKDTPAISEFSVVPMNTQMYATTSVYIRSGASTTSEILGSLVKGDKVTVTGKVQRNGVDLGWYQISHNGGNGYVYAEFLSSNAPAQQSSTENKQQSGIRYTGVVKTVYGPDGSAVTIYQASDGNWYDTNGRLYYATDDYHFASNSTEYSLNRPQTESSGNEPISGGFTVYWGNSNPDTLTLYSDGYYYSSSWVRYTDNGNGTYSGADGTTLYSYDPISAAIANEEEGEEIADGGSGNSYYLESAGSGRPANITYSGGSYYDENGVEYYNQNDGSFIDENGDTFWIR